MNRILTALTACLAIILAVPAGAAEPSSKPLRVVMQISENQPAIWNPALNNIRNSQKDLGVKNIEIIRTQAEGYAYLRP